LAQILYLQTNKKFDQPLNYNSKNNSLIELPQEERLCLINSKESGAFSMGYTSFRSIYFLSIIFLLGADVRIQDHEINS